MNSSLAPVRWWSEWGSRLALALTVVIVVGTMLNPEAGAWKAKTHTSIGVRTQAQSGLCSVSGGNFSSSTNPFGGTTTICTGGKNPQRCVNATKSTSCHKLRTPPPPPGDGQTAPTDIGLRAEIHDGGPDDQETQNRKRDRRGDDGNERRR